MVDTSPLIPQGDEEKLGHKICGECLYLDHYYFVHNFVSSLMLTNMSCVYLVSYHNLTIGCCCDSRRAVLVYSIIYVIFNIIALIVGAAYQSITSALIAILIVSIIIRFITITGACMYNKWMVGLGATWEIINVILSIVVAARNSVNGTIYWSYCNGNGCTYYNTPTWVSIVWALVWSGLILYVSSTFT